MPTINHCSRSGSLVNLEFTDGKKGSLPFFWLRDNCRCDDCYDFVAIARKYTPIGVNCSDIEPTEVWTENGTMNIKWTDEHLSTYDNGWLYEKGTEPHASVSYLNILSLDKEILPDICEPLYFDFNEILENEEELHEWLKSLELKGYSIIKDAPLEEGTGPKFLNKIAFAKLTQFGNLCTVRQATNHSYPAFTNMSLGLHTDLSYYEIPPGIILIHFLKQQEGSGGESLLTDGFSVANQMREKHVQEFKILASTPTYFYDIANPKFDKTSNRYKINATPIIRLDQNGNVCKITFDNTKRDAAVDLPPEKVPDYYRALKVFHALIYKHAKETKMQPGYIVALDNMRMLHGRKAFDREIERHLEVSYLDWDEAKSLRRCLQEKLSLKQ